MPLRRASGHDQLQLPARRLASGRAGLPGGESRPLRDRHRRSQHAGRRRARLFGGEGLLRRDRAPRRQVDQAAGRRSARNPRRLFAARLSDECRGLQAAVAAAEPGQSRSGERRMRSHLRGSRRICRRHPGHRPAAAEDRGSRLSRASCAGLPASIAAAATLPPPCCSAATMRRGWPTRRSRDADEGAPRRHQRRALPRARAPGAARRRHRHPPQMHGRGAGLPSLRLGRAPPQAGRKRWHRLFRKHPHAIERIREIVDRCKFSLDQLRYQYPSNTRAARRRCRSSSD